MTWPAQPTAPSGNYTGPSRGRTVFRNIDSKFLGSLKASSVSLSASWALLPRCTNSISRCVRRLHSGCCFLAMLFSRFGFQFHCRGNLGSVFLHGLVFSDLLASLLSVPDAKGLYRRRRRFRCLRHPLWGSRPHPPFPRLRAGWPFHALPSWLLFSPAC